MKQNSLAMPSLNSETSGWEDRNLTQLPPLNCRSQYINATSAIHFVKLLLPGLLMFILSLCIMHTGGTFLLKSTHKKTVV